MNIKTAKENDAKRIYELMLSVYEGLSNKEIFMCDDLDYVERHIEKEGFTVLAEEDSKLAGFLMVRFPMASEDNLGRDLKLAEETLFRVAHLESAVVSPTFRGMGLQGKMIQYAIETLKKTGYRFLCATVSPDNPASYLTLERAGLEHKLTKEKYGGKMRRIYMREINQEL